MEDLSSYPLELAGPDIPMVRFMNVRKSYGDLIVLDNRLPKESGIELVRRLRERAVKSKVILMTAYETPEVKAEAKRLKVDRYVRKPFDLTVFVEEVRNLIGPAGNATAG